MQLFIKLYLDEDVHILVANLLLSRGFDAITARDAELLGTDDQTQLGYAVQEQRTILTHNRADFELLAQQYVLNEQNHFGIIIATRFLPHEITRRLLRILNDVTADEMLNQVYYI